VKAGLYVVATPIGNLGDITHRALEVLGSVDIIAAEDTRHSRRLLQHFNIETPLVAYHDHSDERATAKIVEQLCDGKAVALISDAGTPLISDPGYRLVREVQDAGVPVMPIPGACAAVAALSACGLPTDRFLFEGFLPAKSGTRANRLQALAKQPATLVFYEAPHRIRESVDAMVEAFGREREAVIAREVSKAFETIHRAPLAQLLQFIDGDTNQQRGEIVLMVAGWREEQEGLSPEVEQLLRRLAEELPAKRAAAVVADITGLRKKALYQVLIS
jgi:16S rRNA (cytidine1402-2'-O)-methyltransferase